MGHDSPRGVVLPHSVQWGATVRRPDAIGFRYRNEAPAGSVDSRPRALAISATERGFQISSGLSSRSGRCARGKWNLLNLKLFSEGVGLRERLRGLKPSLFSAESERYDSASPCVWSPQSMNRIRAARQSLGWTQNELARKAGISARTIHAIEKGRPCRQATKRRILNALGVPWDLRDEYFQRVRSVRPVSTAADEARSA